MISVFGSIVYAFYIILQGVSCLCVVLGGFLCANL